MADNLAIGPEWEQVPDEFVIHIAPAAETPSARSQPPGVPDGWEVVPDEFIQPLSSDDNESLLDSIKAINKDITAKKLAQSAILGGQNLIGGLANLGEIILPGTTEEGRQATQRGIQRLDELRREYVGDPEYQTPPGRITGKVAEYAPGIAIPGGTVAQRVVANALSGIGGGAAIEAGLPEWVGAIAAPVGATAASKTLPAVLSPVRTIAGKTIATEVGPEGVKNIMRSLANEGDTVLTMAERAQTPGAAMYERSLRNEGIPALEELLTKRVEDVKGLVTDFAPEALTGELQSIRGAAIQKSLAEKAAEATKQAGAAYKNLKLTGAVPVESIKKEVLPLVDEIFGKTGLPMNAKTRNVLKTFFNAAKKRGEVSFDQIKATTQALNSVSSELAAANPKDLNLPIIRRAQELMDEATERAIASGAVPAEQKTAWEAARKQYRETMQKYGEDSAVGAIVKKDRSASGFVMSPEDAAAQITRNPQSAKDVMAAIGDDPALLEKVRSQAVDKILGGDKISNIKDVDSWARLIDKNRDVLTQIGGGKFPEQLQKAAKIISRQQSTREMATRPSKGQSFTTQGVTYALNRVMAGGFRGLLKLGGSQFASGMAVMGEPIYLIATFGANRLNKAVDAAIKNAITDPKALDLLMRSGTRRNTAVAVEALAPFVVRELSRLEQQQSARSDAKLTTEEPQFESNPATSLKYSQKSDNKKQEKTVDQTDPNFKNLLKAVALQESGGNPNAVSPVGAVGLHQIMPATGAELAKELGLEDYDLKDPETNTKMASLYLQKLLKQFGGDPELALAAYHSGPGRVSRLLKVYGGKTFKDIQPYLGPVGRRYPGGVMTKLRRLTGSGIVKV